MKTSLAALSAAALLSAAPAQALEINVLWTAGSSSYNADMTTLAATAGSYDPAGDGSLDWDLTFWDLTGATPDFSLYDVLVIASDDNGFSTGMDGDLLLDDGAAITAARGERTFVTGQDADWHYQNRPGAVDDGPRGFIINAVNWAASGAGLGIVSFTDGWSGTGSNWWTKEGSFLKSELEDVVSYFQSDSVQIGAGQDLFPVNEGLTSGGLSNWGTSSHSGFQALSPGYTTINFTGAGSTGLAVTMVTEGFEQGDTEGSGAIDNVDGAVPLPAPAALLLAGLGAVGALRRRRG